jgi:hypothetical protein
MHSVYGFYFGPGQEVNKMKINKKNALKLWESAYGNSRYAEDFHGNLMYREAYGNPDYCVFNNGEFIYCGWNVHHILPKALGGSSSISNLICTNIATNDEAEDKITFWIDDCLYQVQKQERGYGIVRLR